MENVFICIDLKSFYASVECVDRNLNPLTTNLVVADSSRTEKTICLAVSPSLKALGISGRPRLFEVNQTVKKINSNRLKENKKHQFSKKSTNSLELENNSDYEISFIIAKPRMAKYIEISSKIYEIYLKYIGKDDIHVYSIDEVFIDATKYLKALNMTGYELARTMIKDVLDNTGITATAGIGTNMYLAKVSMDIVAKHIPPDQDGVRIASLDEKSYKEKLWSHTPLTDFWRVGRGYQERLNRLGLYTMGDIALCSVGKNDDYYNEDLLYKEFGINAELLIDHAWGYEPCRMSDIKSYKPDNSSLSIGQVLLEPYSYDDGLIVLKEMIDNLALSLVEKKLMTNAIGIYIGYDSQSLLDQEVKKSYKGQIAKDFYGKNVPKPAQGHVNFEEYTSSSTLLTRYASALYEKIVNPNLKIRRVNVVASNVINENDVVSSSYFQMSLFVDQEALEKRKKNDKKAQEKEKKAQETILSIKKKYGKNSILKGTNFFEKSTGKDRNEQIGGHKA
ncbi:MAG: DNA methylase [Bacillales bacterium]|nr:DNA methylase [Bacillales bacterium]